MRRERYEGVTAFVGMPGSGKTYSLAKVGLQALARGERVICNAGFDLAGAEVMSTFDEFASIEGPVTVVWDELPLYFNARKWAEFPDSMLYKFTQIRKDGIKLYYSAIHELMIDTTIRRITFWFWHCSALGFGYHRASMYGPEEVRKSTVKPLRTRWFRIDERIAAAYDTYGKVELPTIARRRIAAGVPEEGSWKRPELPEAAVPPQGAAAVSRGAVELPRAPERAKIARPDGGRSLGF